MNSADAKRAYEALEKNAKLPELVGIARTLLFAAAELRRQDWADAARVQSLAGDAKVTAADFETPFGNALSVLERGPEDDAERALACALLAHVLAADAPTSRDQCDRASEDLLWLATHTPFDATDLLDDALGESAEPLWNAIADRVQRIDRGKFPALGRAEALVGAVALASSKSKVADRLVAALRGDARDAKLLWVLAPNKSSTEAERLVGEMAIAPRGTIATTLLACTGILFVMHAARLVAKWALAYKKPVELTLSRDSVRLHVRTEVLGRTLRDREIVLPRNGLVRAAREIRYPRVAFYAGLFALVVGSYFGMTKFVDGVRGASPSLIGLGLLIVAAGIALDFALMSLEPVKQGVCRILLVPRNGADLCIGGVETKSADRALSRLTS